MTEVTHRLYRVLNQFLDELHPSRKEKHNIGYHSQLNRDLGLDSLGRAELLTRIEGEFDLILPDTLLTESKTLQDLITGILAAEGKSNIANQQSVNFLPPDHASEIPEHETTLSSVLEWHAENHPERALGGGQELWRPGKEPGGCPEDHQGRRSH